MEKTLLVIGFASTFSNSQDGYNDRPGRDDGTDDLKVLC
jgi:hypothetical protein